MNQQLLQWLALAILFLAQSVLAALKIIEKRNGKKKENDKKKNEENPGNPHPCPYVERIPKLETEVSDIKEDIRKIERRLEKIENGMRKT